MTPWHCSSLPGRHERLMGVSSRPREVLSRPTARIMRETAKVTSHIDCNAAAVRKYRCCAERPTAHHDPCDSPCASWVFSPDSLFRLFGERLRSKINKQRRGWTSYQGLCVQATIVHWHAWQRESGQVGKCKI